MVTAVQKTIPADSRRRIARFHPDQYLSFANLAEAFFHNANTNFDLIAYDQAIIDPEFSERPRRYVSTLHRTSKQRVLRIAAQLEAWGVAPGEPVAVLSLNRPEWTEAEMAIYTVGAIAVALYVRISPDRLQHMVRDAGARCAIVENGEQLAAILRASEGSQGSARDQGLSPQPPTERLEHILTFEDVEAARGAVRAGLDLKTLQSVLEEQPVRDERSFAFIHTRREDVASVYYTSGSSGIPTGVPVTHGQVLANLHQIAESRLVDYTRYEQPNAPAVQPFVTLLLPERAHAFPARTTQLVAMSPARARYPAVVDRKTSCISQAYRDSIRRDLREGAAGLVPIVPKILVAIEQRVRERLASGGLAERLARFVVENAARKMYKDARGTPHVLTNWIYRGLGPLRRRITNQIRSQIVGPQFEYFISGGAKLPLETAAFLWAINLPVYEGYGSTESNCPVATNMPHQYRLGSVGKLFRGVEGKVDPDSGELWLRGPNVVQRYWHAAGDRNHAWTADGWYRTRDVGRLDDDGFLYIEDRVDNILVLWNGENVSASAVEQRFCAIPYVDTAVVVGHQRPVLVALVAINEDMLRRWADRAGHSLGADWRRDPAVMRLLREQIEVHVNRRAGHACERVRHVGVIDPPAPEDQTLTATEKVRRREVERRYASLIEHLYEAQGEWLPAYGPEPDCAAKAIQLAAPAGITGASG